MKNLLPLFIALSMMASSCAAILNGRTQSISIRTAEGTDIKINGDEPTLKDGKVVVPRDGRFQQVTISKEGYKDQNYVIAQGSISPLYFFSWIPFGITIYAPFYDPVSPWSYDYPPTYTFEGNMVKLPQKEDNGMDIMLNKVGLDLAGERIQFRLYHRLKFYRKGITLQESSLAGESENFTLENTVFSQILNDLLKERGFVDTTRKVFKRSYLNNVLLNATVTRYRINQVNSRWRTAMMTVDMTIDWEVLDYYNQRIGSLTTEVKSGEFPFSTYGESMRLTLETAISDAMEYGLIELLQGEEFKPILEGRQQEQIEKDFEPFPVNSGGKYASGVAEAAKSTVTIKSKEGHGSGFIIGSDGFVITNHHVVLDSTPPMVVLNDGREFEATIIRESLIHDLALLKIEAPGLKPLKVSESHDFELASEVYVIGTPTAEDLPQTVSRGIISGIRSPRENTRLIQTDASVNGGNSGGPIINNQGEVIGVVSTKVWGLGIEGVAFGIPGYEIMDRLKVVFQ